MNSTLRLDQSQVDSLLPKLLPSQGYWSDDDYLWLTDHTNQLIEFTEGYLEILPMPTDRHQTLLLYIYDILRQWARDHGGKVLVAPVRLRVREGKFREPDLMMLKDSKDPRRADRYWSGADLVVEVVSPDRPERDWIDKRVDYAQAGIPEYWIVDPEKKTLAILRLENGAYELSSDSLNPAYSHVLASSFQLGELFEAD